MSSESTTRWPLLEERLPFATAGHRTARRKLPRSAWLLIGLAFLCGGLVSAAAFSIGWRHQAQRDTAAQTALAAATAHVRTLEGRIARLEESLGTARQAEAEAVASSHALTAAAGKVAAEATASGRAASSLSSDAASLTASAARIASELKTLETYLATTPAGQLDPGYVVSQTAYLTRQLDALKIDGGRLGDSVAGFEATARKLAHDAAVLSTRS